MLEDIIIYTPMYVTLIWGIILLSTRYRNNRAKFFLGIFMMVAFLLYLSHALFFKRNTAAYKFFDPVYIFAVLSVYPLYYWYIKLLTVETTVRIYNLRMFIPAFLFSGVSFILYRNMSEAETVTYINGFLLGINDNLPDSLPVKLLEGNYILVRIVFGIQVIVCLVKGNRKITAYNRQVANFYSNLESKSILWVRFFLYSMILTAIMSTVFNIIGRSLFIESKLLLLIPSVIFSVLLFLIGQIGSMQDHTVNDLESDRLSHPVPDNRKYTNEQLIKKISELFSIQNAYRNPELKITDVARMLNTNRTYVSELINSEFSCSFVEFVNRYRLKEAKRLLNEFEPEKFTIAEISEHAGFGSPGTFIRVFKQSEGITPGKYRDKIYPRTTQLPDAVPGGKIQPMNR